MVLPLTQTFDELAKRATVFGSPRRGPLTIEMLPVSTWGKNLRLLPKPTWDSIRRDCYRRARCRCEVCGGQGPDHPVECHEVWSYCLQGLPPRKVQKLVGVVALCPDCHAVKHLGRTRKVGGVFLRRAQDRSLSAARKDVLLCVEELAIEHLCRVNGWTAREARLHQRDALERWKVRDEFLWEVDLTLLGGPRLEADDSFDEAIERVVRTFGEF